MKRYFQFNWHISITLRELLKYQIDTIGYEDALTRNTNLFILYSTCDHRKPFGRSVLIFNPLLGQVLNTNSKAKIRFYRTQTATLPLHTFHNKHTQARTHRK